jgi:hypothetical protein
MVQILCPACKALVEVCEKTVAEHDGCPMGGMRYVPSPKTFKAGAGAPAVEVLGIKPARGICKDGQLHEGIVVIARVTQPDPKVN